MEKKWWHEKVAYQIYPKSFMDSDNDGIGDLQGIISKLDYLQELGVEIVWLSPIYCSPLADQGYDISDYYNIDPIFGTMDDMDELIAEAKKRNIGIVMDLVVNHCSDEHEWFKKACEDPDGKYGKYFYIEDIKDGQYPCNWRSYFGGGVWEPLPGHPDKCYLHVFHTVSPGNVFNLRHCHSHCCRVAKDAYRCQSQLLPAGLSGSDGHVCRNRLVFLFACPGAHVLKPVYHNGRLGRHAVLCGQACGHGSHGYTYYIYI